MRYSIAKRIKDRSGEDTKDVNILQIEDETDVSDANEKGGHGIDKPYYIILPK